jgi:hypothetical protein
MHCSLFTVRYSLLCLLCLPAGFLCRAQENEAAGYLRQAGAGAVIYSGREEADYSRIREHPYMDTEQYHEGTLRFDGRAYPALRMRLNVYADALTLLLPDYRADVAVDPERVDSAVFSSFAVFYHVPAEDDAKTQRSLPDKGYYVRLHNGKYPVWKRQIKVIERRADGMNIEQVFVPRTRYYIYKDGRYQSAGSKRSLLKLFAPEKKELNRYISREHLNFREAPDEAIVRTVMHYESLNP